MLYFDTQAYQTKVNSTLIYLLKVTKQPKKRKKKENDLLQDFQNLAKRQKLNCQHRSKVIMTVIVPQAIITYVYIHCAWREKKSNDEYKETLIIHAVHPGYVTLTHYITLDVMQNNMFNFSH